MPSTKPSRRSSKLRGRPASSDSDFDEFWVEDEALSLEPTAHHPPTNTNATRAFESADEAGTDFGDTDDLIGDTTRPTTSKRTMLSQRNPSRLSGRHRLRPSTGSSPTSSEDFGDSTGSGGETETDQSTYGRAYSRSHGHTRIDAGRPRRRTRRKKTPVYSSTSSHRAGPHQDQVLGAAGILSVIGTALLCAASPSVVVVQPNTRAYAWPSRPARYSLRPSHHSFLSPSRTYVLPTYHTAHKSLAHRHKITRTTARKTARFRLI